MTGTSELLISRAALGFVVRVTMVSRIVFFALEWWPPAEAGGHP